MHIFLLANQAKELVKHKENGMFILNQIFYKIIKTSIAGRTKVTLTISPSDVEYFKNLGYKLTFKGRDGDHGDSYLISWS